jgi:hypothetical protein
LICRLAVAGAASLVTDRHIRQTRRLAKMAALAGRYPSTLGPDYLESLRAEWDG